MSVKRQATTELNHENWDQDDPADQEEETGGFKMASREVLEKRVIRTAKRRSQVTGDEAKRSVFSGFSGFNKTQQTSFDFLAKLTNGNNANNAPTSKSETLAATNSLNTTTMSSLSSETVSISGTSTPLTKPTFGKSTAESSFLGVDTKISGFSQSVFTTARPNTTASESPFKIQSAQSPIFNTSKLNTNNEKPAPPISSNIFGSSSSTTAGSAKSLFSTTSNNSAPAKPQPASTPQSSETNKSDIEKDPKLVYYNQLKGLNDSVSDWIKKHVEETPLCILTPIFRDYEKYLKEIQEIYEKGKEKAKTVTSSDNKQNNTEVKATSSPKFGNTNSSLFPTSSNVFTNTKSSAISPEKTSNLSMGLNTSSNATTNNFSTTSPPSSGFSFGIKASTTNTSPFAVNTTPATTNTSLFGVNATSATTNTSPFGVKTTPATTNTSPFAVNPSPITTNTSPFAVKATPTTTNTSPFSVKATPATNTNGSAPFSFGIGKPFSFNSNVQKNEEPAKDGDENEDEPPKVEYTPIVEENSVYDKKCKVFVKKDGNFIDKGVGTLYIKKIEDSGKHQLLVRANTSLGNVLLNFILGSSIPTQRMGKNNVMMICIPTPDAKPPPTSILIRVKTSEEADELLETLNKYKV